MSLKTSNQHYLRNVWPMLRQIIKVERRDIVIVAIYSVVTSILGLAVPLVSQGIVNTVALGVFSQQLVVLSSIVLITMIAVAFIAVFERYVVEMIQRRMFVAAAYDFVYRIPRFTQDSVHASYSPELVNRFFDVVTIQKSFGKFLLDGLNSALVLITGLIVLGLYHPFFLVYGLLFMLFIPVLVWGLGRGALGTAVAISQEKYRAAAWLEDVARNQLAFKLSNAEHFTRTRTENINLEYLHARQMHHMIFIRQIFGSYVFKGLATVGVLFLGGILVIEQSISLGQLVAAEIIMILILGAMEKLISQFDVYYDLIAAFEKLKNILDQPLDREDGLSVPAIPNGGSITVHDVYYAYNSQAVLEGVSLSITPGQRVSLVGASGAGKSTLAQIILGLNTPSRGWVDVNGVDIRTASLVSLRSHIGYVFPENQIVPATILENIMFGRTISNEDLNWALKLAKLTDAVRDHPNGLDTMVWTTGENVSYGMRRRILFARMIIGKPDILIIDEAFEGIEDSMKLAMINDLIAWPHWTILNISHDPEVVRCTSIVHVLAGGRIIEQGSPSDLHKMNGAFTSLFPDARYFYESSTEHPRD